MYVRCGKGKMKMLALLQMMPRRGWGWNRGLSVVALMSSKVVEDEHALD